MDSALIDFQAESAKAQAELSGYLRISVDDDLSIESNTIEHQKLMIQEYAKRKFPNQTITFYEDRDKSGYTFEHRKDYQRMRKNLGVFHKVLILNDLSRFSRRNGQGLVELEHLRDIGVRIISIQEDIDYPAKDDWIKIQIYFFVNEMPVTQTSSKVRAVVDYRQKSGTWLCSAPYGYRLVGAERDMRFEVNQATAPIIQMIFNLYIDGWGYNKIAQHLTNLNIATPRMVEKEYVEANGKTYKGKTSTTWNPVSVSHIIENDFYIGTLRTHKYARTKINGNDKKVDKSEHIVFENNHEPIIDFKTFSLAQAERKKREKSGYRGIKKYANPYSGFIFCGDCGSPMFAMSRSDLSPAYTCGTYHRQGVKGCSSHHIRVDILDEMVKTYLRMVRDNCSFMMETLKKAVASSNEDIDSNAESILALEENLTSSKEQLKATQIQKIKALTKNPEQAEILEETYLEIEAELFDRIEGLKNQIALCNDSHNTLVQTTRASKTVLDIFDDILNKEQLTKRDLSILIKDITVYDVKGKNRIDINLYPDIDALLTTGELINFEQGTENISPRSITIAQSSRNRRDKVFSVNVVNKGDPLEIYTDKEGGVIFRKYSQMSGLTDFADEMCESLSKTTGQIAVITDRDTVIAVSGVPRRELHEKHVSRPLEQVMERRRLHQSREEDTPIPVTDETDKYSVISASPILSEGDVLGCVLFVAGEGGKRTAGEIEEKLLQTISGFLGRHMEG